MHANMSQGNILSQFGRLADNPGKATFSICSPKSLAQVFSFLTAVPASRLDVLSSQLLQDAAEPYINLPCAQTVQHVCESGNACAA